jgi:photosystem II stability/assembly factor-like uncharacterized protein
MSLCDVGLTRLMRFFSLLLLVSVVVAGDLARAQGQKRWEKESSGTSAEVADISYPCKDSAFVLAGLGIGPLRSIDGGTTWQPFPAPEDGFFRFSDSKSGFLASWAGNSVYHTTDAGLTWDTVNDACHLVIFVIPLTKDTAFLSGYGNLSRTIDGGKTWEALEVPIGSQGGIAFADTKRGIILGGPQPFPGGQDTLEAACFTTTDGGMTWIQHRTHISVELGGAIYLGRDTVIALGLPSIFLKSTNGGLTWDSIPFAGGYVAIDHKGSRIIAVGDAGAIATSTDRGLSWALEESGVGSYIGAIAMLDESNAIASTDKGEILKTTNGGVQWVEVYPPSPIPIQTLAFPQPETATQEIEYSLPQLQHVTVRVYDLTGHMIQTLLDKELQPAGEHRVTFRGDGLPAGTYIYHIDTERYHASGKSVLVK